MKTPSNELFLLIKSLTEYEKRCFRIFSNKTTENSGYLSMFDTLDSMEYYDEKLLFSKLSRKGGAQDVRHLKRYLLKTLLFFLERYFYDYSVEVELQRYLQKIEIFFNKHLFNSAKKLVAKAEKITIDNDKYDYLLLVYEWRRKIILASSDIKELKEYNESGYLEEMKISNINRNILEYESLNMKLNGIVKSSVPYGDNIMKQELLMMLQSPLLKDGAQTLSDKAEALYHSIRAHIFMYFPDSWDKSYESHKKSIEIYEKKNLFKNENAFTYMSFLISFTFCLIALDRKEEFFQYVRKAERFFNSQPKKMQAGNFMTKYLGLIVNYIWYQTFLGNLNEALQKSESIKAMIDDCVDTSLYLSFYGNYIIILFETQNYNLALRACNNLLFKEKANLGKNIFHDFQMINLLIHYELGNYDLLLNLCKSIKRSFERQGTLKSDDKIILDFFLNTVNNVNSKKELKQVFGNLKLKLEESNLKEITPVELGKGMLIRNWIERKLNSE